MKVLKLFVVLLLQILLYNNIIAQPETAISSQIGLGGASSDLFTTLKQTNDGGFIIGGYSNSNTSGTKNEDSKGNYDYWIIKLDHSLTPVFQKTIGGSNYDDLRVIIPTEDEGYLLGGYSNSNISGDKTEDSRGGYDVWIIKIDKNGEIEWQKTIGGNGDDVLYALNQSSDGGFILGAHSKSIISGEKTESLFGNYDYWIIKIDASGNIEWQKTYGGVNDDILRSIETTMDGGYIIGGNSKSGQSGNKLEENQGNWDIWVLKVDGLGNIEWQNNIGGNHEDYANKTIELSNNDFFIGGGSYSPISGDKTESSFNGNADLWLLKLDENGNIIWQSTIGGDLWDMTYDICTGKNNSVIIGANSSSNLSIDKTEPTEGSVDFWILKINSDGNIDWQNNIGGSGGDYLNSIIKTSSNQFIIGGYSNSGFSGEKNQPSYGSQDFWILKLFEDPLTITGNIFYDENNNCNLSTENSVFKNFSLRANNTDGDAFYTSTDTTGKYLLSVDDTGSYAFQLLPNESFNLYQPSACNNYNLHLTDTIDTLNFGMHPTKSCLFNTVNISTNSLFRRCMENTFYVQYANNGTISSPNTYIDVHLDDLLAFNSASIPYQDLGNNVYRFELGTVDLLESGQFTFNATPICDLTTNGQTLCVEAHIYPDSVCTLVDYRGANISASGECLGDSVRFILRNRGGNMAEPKVYIVIEGDVVRIREDYQLAANEELEVKIKAVNGATYRIIAEQPTDFPSELGDNFTTAVVEGCRPNPDDPFETGFVNQFSNYDGEPYSSVSCNTLIGSYDPNDKSAFPVGVGNQHFVEVNTDIDYLIRFQNTGNDTAFKVVLVDTISNFLDINSIELGASSHPYNFERIDSNVVQFVFSPIYLIDSFTNEPASNGFVKFKIHQKKDVPVGTTINNTADIYFDFNAPIRTNTTMHTIGKDFLQIQLTDIKNHTQQSVTIKAFPNPFKDKTFIYITSGNIEDAVLVLTNIQGQVIKTIPVNNGNQFEIHRNDLPVGVYFFSILSQNKILSSGKLIAE
ncbi:MAG: T9SS type A sorting domain-containing protein [Chitinophagales bacterium]|nr:T9SS type A sorting domain-containing protein [Chitinophagales bacterium]